MNTSLSIIIITHNRNKLLKRCLESILKSSVKTGYELIAVVNGPDEATVKLLNSFLTKLPDLKFFSIPKITKGSARNVGLKNAQGDVLYFIDDDVEIEGDNLKKLIEKFTQNSEIDIIGGPNLTPEKSSFFQRCTGYLLSSIFGSAGMRFRYAVLPEEKLADDRYLILCNLAFRKKIFAQENINFNGDVACNEENLLLYNLKRKGYKILYSPSIIVYHQRRSNLLLLIEQFFRYGRGRGQMTRIHPESLPLFTLLPSIFIVYVISLFFSRNLFYLAPLFLYIALDVLFSIRIKEIKAFPLLFILFPISHFSYGLGFLLGLVK